MFGIRAGTSDSSLKMAEIAEGVTFDTVAREWRCKWSPDGDKASLVAAQTALNTVLEDIKAVDGVKGVSSFKNIIEGFYKCQVFCGRKLWVLLQHA